MSKYKDATSFGRRSLQKAFDDIDGRLSALEHPAHWPTPATEVEDPMVFTCSLCGKKSKCHEDVEKNFSDAGNTYFVIGHMLCVECGLKHKKQLEDYARTHQPEPAPSEPTDETATKKTWGSELLRGIPYYYVPDFTLRSGGAFYALTPDQIKSEYMRLFPSAEVAQDFLKAASLGNPSNIPQLSELLKLIANGDFYSAKHLMIHFRLMSNVLDTAIKAGLECRI